MTQPVEILNNPIEPRVGVRSFIQTYDQRFDKFTGQSDDALIFGLNARSGLQRKPRDIDGKTEHEDERQKHVEPGA
jgi:hypothetical protein